MTVSRDGDCLDALVNRPWESREAGGCVSSGAEIHFRGMDPSDLEHILRIENASFAYPWSARFFLQELRVPCARSLLAIVSGKPVGYIIYWVLPSDVDIHDLAVDPSYRRRGIGRALLAAVIGEARNRGSTRVTLEVRKSNETAQKLYQSLGFVEDGVRRGYYSDNGEDALLMVFEIKR
ncbi:MAG: ribosomal protein S18-alanine N-acetyltransferase [Candidatus Binatia bacterium]